MEQQRGFLLIVFLFISFMVYTTWEADKQAAEQLASQQTTQTSGPSSSPTGAPADPIQNDVAGGDEDRPMPLTQNNTQTTTTTTQTQHASQGKLIEIETDALHVWIDTQGGGIAKTELKHYPVSSDNKEVKYVLLDDTPIRTFKAQPGFHVGQKQYKNLTPNSKTIYKVEADRFPISEGAEAFNVDLSWFNAEGTEFIIRYAFEKDSHNVKVSHIVKANSAAAKWQGYTYAEITRNDPQSSGSVMLPTYTGPVYYHPEDKYDKVDFDDIDESYNRANGQFDAIEREFNGGWIGVIEHYFVGAFVPPSTDVYRYYTRKPNKGRSNSYIIGIISLEQTVDINNPYETTMQLYIGPKTQDVLEEIAEGLELSVDYGWLTFVAKPLFWILDSINSFVHNWGWSIILLTILIKLAFYKLSEASYKSMANMRRVGPRMKQIKERYAGDRQRMNQAMMELYRKEKINPLGGCLPILIQIPVFIALYYVLLESVELRQAEWALWITDLSIKDPYFILPIIMGVSMIAQQKLNPAPLDPMQAKIMMFLPVVFTVLFMFFPAGLVLYWVVNNLLSILQQWYITRVVMKDKKT